MLYVTYTRQALNAKVGTNSTLWITREKKSALCVEFVHNAPYLILKLSFGSLDKKILTKFFGKPSDNNSKIQIRSQYQTQSEIKKQT